MAKRERLEMTFGEKDMDIWEYLEASGLPKASLAKKMLRDAIKNEAAVKSVVVPASTPAPAPVQEVVKAFEKEAEQVVEAEEQSKKKNSFFGNAVVKK